MTRRKHEGANVTFDPAVAPNHFDSLRVSPRPYCSAAFKAAVECAATFVRRKNNRHCLTLPTAPNFWLGLILLYIFGLKLGRFPIASSTVTAKGIVLPALTLARLNQKPDHKRPESPRP